MKETTIKTISNFIHYMLILIFIHYILKFEWNIAIVIAVSLDILLEIKEEIKQL